MIKTEQPPVAPYVLKQWMDFHAAYCTIIQYKLAVIVCRPTHRTRRYAVGTYVVWSLPMNVVPTILDLKICTLQSIVQSVLRLSSGVDNRGTLVNDQLDAQIFSMCLFQFSTCFEQPRAHHQESQLYQYNIQYMSLYVGDHFVCRSEKKFSTYTRNGHRHRLTYTICCIDKIYSSDDEHEVARNMWRIKINT
jgi:hypothetical protein